MNINELTLGQRKEIYMIVNCGKKRETLDNQLGEKVIIRTCSAGVWFGKLVEKSGNEVILENARRLFFWKCNESISLSGLAKYGLNQNESKVAPAVDKVWLEAIEIISLNVVSIKSIEESAIVKAE